MKIPVCYLQKLSMLTIVILSVCYTISTNAQNVSLPVKWIQPATEKDAPIWGIKNGIVVALWPATIECPNTNKDDSPRGLLRIGYNYMGATYLVNFIAIEPVVNGNMEFSEVSPSQVDGKWGKLLWASDTITNNHFSAYASTRGTITHPDSQHPETEELSFYVFMEKFLNGAHPYLKLSIRSDNADELCLQVFNEKNSDTMERCALTATMGNYERLRLLYLQKKVIDSRQLFDGYDGIDFVEKEPYSINQLMRTKKGDFIVLAESNEDFSQLASWPQQPSYLKKWNWRYRPFFKLTQYWRKEAADADSTLQVRVNGRIKYWSGESSNLNDYINIPGGAAFENFEMRENYHFGERFYFGISTKSAIELIKSFK